MALSIAGLFSAVGLIASPSPLILVSSGLCLALIVWLLWSDDEPPILLLPALFQWSEVSTPAISTLWKRLPLNQLSAYNADLDSAAIFGLAAVVLLALGMRIGAGRSNRQAFADRIRLNAMAWRYEDLARIAFGAIVLGYVASFLFRFAGPARELCNQVSNVKYVGLFAIAYWCLTRRRHMLVLAGVVAFEVVFGMTGFFADFKNSILTFLVAAIAARARLRAADLGWATSAGLLLIVVAIFWSAVKGDYRDFVNQGSGAQVVMEPLDQRLQFLTNAAREMDGERFSYGFNRLVDRHGYIEFLAATMANVPAATPYENGRLTLETLQHISTPRFLFPDKAVLPNDTEITKRYTGLNLGTDENRSISIGYLGELYVDFGYFGALFAVVIMGALVGLAYRRLRDQGRAPALLLAGLCMVVVLPLAYFGQPYNKTVGAAVFSTAVAFVALQFYRLMLAKSSQPARTSWFPASRTVGNNY